MDNLKLPPISKELLDVLEKRFPDRMPESPRDLEDYLVKQGQVSVVRFLRYHFDLQNQNILEN